MAELQELLRQPSISAQNVGLEECAALLRGQMIADGFANTRILPVPGAPPLVYATQAAAAANAKTLLCYSHYDVQPPEPLEKWIDPPFQRGDPGRRHLCAGGDRQQVGRAVVCAGCAGL